MTYYVDSCLQLLQAHGSKIITLGLSDKHLTQLLFDLVPNATTLRLHVSCAEPRAWQTPHHYLGSPAHEYDSQPFVHLQHVSVQRIIPLWEGYGMVFSLPKNHIAELHRSKVRITIVQDAGRIAAQWGGSWQPPCTACSSTRPTRAIQEIHLAKDRVRVQRRCASLSNIV